MTYIEQLIKGEVKPKGSQIALSDYIKETIYITKYMSPRVKATNIATYHAMFYLSYGLNGTGDISLPWPTIGELCGNERGDGVVTKNEAVRSRTKMLQELGCINVVRNRTGTNSFYVYKPSEIDFVSDALKLDSSTSEPMKTSKIDSYNELSRKLRILERDSYKCVYCLKKIDKDSFYLDHIVPRASSGTNYKNNLVSSCVSCNAKKSDNDVWIFLKENYRNDLLSQDEYLCQKKYIEKISADDDTGEP